MEKDLFVSPYSEDGDNWLLVYKGNIHNNNKKKYYSAMYVGNVNMDKRFFIRGDKFLQKVIDQKNHMIQLVYLKESMYKFHHYFKDVNGELAPIGSDIIKIILSSQQVTSEAPPKILLF